MVVIETLGLAAGLLLLVLMAAGPAIVELNDRLPVRTERRPRIHTAPRPVFKARMTA